MLAGLRTTTALLLLVTACTVANKHRRPDAGDDASVSCMANQALRCDGANLISCNADGDAEVSEGCAVGCDASALQCGDTYPISWCTGNLLAGDVDGDGANDLICHYPSGSTPGRVDVAFSTLGGSKIRATSSQAMSWCVATEQVPKTELYVGDFDGNHRSDLLCHDFATGEDRIAFSTGDSAAPFGDVWSSTSASTPHPYNWCVNDRTPSIQEITVGDFNGDGRSDLACQNWLPHGGAYTPRMGVLIAEADSAQRFDARPERDAPVGPNMQINSGTWDWCYDAGVRGTRNIPWHDTLLASDVDRDGKDDLICHRPTDGAKFVAFSTYERVNAGSVYFQDPWPGFTGWCTPFDVAGNFVATFFAHDLDGDAVADFGCHDFSNGLTYFMRGHSQTRRGTCGPDAPFDCATNWTRQVPTCQPIGSSQPTVLWTDLDGDKRADFVCHRNDGSTSVEFHPLP